MTQEKVKSAAIEKLRVKGIDVSGDLPVEGPSERKKVEGKEEVGIKEIKELIIFIFALSELTVEVLGDGIGILDLLDVFRDQEVRQQFGPAIRGADEIPNEVADLSMKEIREIADLLWQESWSLWEAIADR